MYSNINIDGKYKNIIAYERLNIFSQDPPATVSFCEVVLNELDPILLPGTGVKLDCYHISFSLTFTHDDAFFFINVRDNVTIAKSDLEIDSIIYTHYTLGDPELLTKVTDDIKNYLDQYKEDHNLETLI